MYRVKLLLANKQTNNIQWHLQQGSVKDCQADGTTMVPYACNGKSVLKQLYLDVDRLYG